ncbi:MAG: hypothetical protein C0613_01535 [Desulfobulbaceae bacterium]|nr:MAG: hypothetical protein C0613_01535 [Desulfobulbaceae bacterium]
MAFSVGGLASGLDTESIISQMMDLERRPILQLQRREATFQSKISALGALKSELSAFQTTAAALTEPDGFIAYSAVSGNSSVLTASASADASEGSYQIEVNSRAASQMVRSASFAGADEVVGTGTLTIQVGSEASVDITIDADNQTLAGIAQAINASDAGVSAAVVDDGTGNVYLALAASATGADNTISLTMADDDGVNTDAAGLSSLYDDPATQSLFETRAAANAQLSLNGIDVERADNSVSDLIDGVTLDLKDADPGTPFTLTVSQSYSAITGKVEKFVEAYNSLVDLFGTLQKYDSETGESGVLQGDSTTRQLQGRLVNLLYAGVDGVPSDINSLSKLGIALDRDGKMSLDSDVLTSAIENNGSDVITFFTNTEEGNKGIAVQFDEMLDSYLSGSGSVLSAKEEGLQSSIDSIGEQIERINYRLSLKEENLRNQFLALEGLMAEYEATSGALEQQLTSLAQLSESIYGK